MAEVLRVFDTKNFAYSGLNKYYLTGQVKIVNGKYTTVDVDASAIRYLLNQVKQYEEDTLVFAIDSDPVIKARMFEDTFEYGTYKGHRNSNESINSQYEKFEGVLSDIYPNVFAVEGYEADDIIASVVLGNLDNFDKIVIHSADSDMHCLIQPKVCTGYVNKSFRYIDRSNFETESVKGKKVLYNSTIVRKWVEGDAKDNIPSASTDSIIKFTSAVGVDEYPNFVDLQYLRNKLYSLVESETDRVILDLIIPLMVPEKDIQISGEHYDSSKLEEYLRLLGLRGANNCNSDYAQGIKLLGGE